MVRRIYIERSTPIFKISQPSVDVVTNTNPNDFIFDAFTGGVFHGAFMSGIIPVSSANWTNNQIGSVFFGQIQCTRLSYRVNFSKVFSQPPQLIYSLRPAGDTSWGGTPRYAHLESINGNAYNYSTNSYVPVNRSGTVFSAMTTTSYADFFVDYLSFSQRGSNNWDVAYLVFQS
jgi:hypothetical protein